MKVTIEITDEKQLALIEKLRGDKTAMEFVQQAAVTGIKLAEHNAKMQDKLIRFAQTKPEFKTLNVAAITDALKSKDAKHPVCIEVGRLVNDYTAQLREHAQKNGNRLPSSLKINTQVPIERVAFKITADAINHRVQEAKKKANSSR